MYLPNTQLFKFLVLLYLFNLASSFPNQSLEDIRDIILQSKPQLIQVTLKPENQVFSAFAIRFLNLLTNFADVCPIIVQTFSNAKGLQYNDTRVNMGYEKVVVHILNDNSGQSIKDCGSVLHRKLKRKQLNRFAVIIEKINSKNPVWLKNLFKEFEKKKVLDVTIFCYDNGLQIFRYNPFLPEQQQLLSLNHTTARNEYQNQYIIKRLNGHRFDTFFYTAGYNVIRDVDGANRSSYRGRNIDMIKLLAERMNITLKYQQIDPKADDVLTVINNKLKLDDDMITINMLSYNKHRYENTGEPCNNFFTMSFPAIVPEAGTLPLYQNMYFALTAESWIFVAASILFVTLLQKFFQLFYRKTIKTNGIEGENIIPFWKSFLRAIQTFVGDSLTKIPQSPSARLILLGWILYSYLVTSAFTAKLLSSLISPRQAENIDTLNQLFESNYQINFITEHKSHFKTYVKNNDLQDKIFNQGNFIRYNLVLENIIGRNLTQRRDAYIMADFILDRFIVQYYDRVDQKPHFHKTKESFMYFPGVYLAQRGTPHLERINYLLGMFHQFGFFVRWVELAIFRDILNAGYVSQQPKEESESKVTLSKEHLQTIFYVWFIGMLCAVFSFTGEFMMASYYSRKKVEATRIKTDTKIRIQNLNR